MVVVAALDYAKLYAKRRITTVRELSVAGRDLNGNADQLLCTLFIALNIQNVCTIVRYYCVCLSKPNVV